MNSLLKWLNWCFRSLLHPSTENNSSAITAKVLWVSLQCHTYCMVISIMKRGGGGSLKGDEWRIIANALSTSQRHLFNLGISFLQKDKIAHEEMDILFPRWKQVEQVEQVELLQPVVIEWQSFHMYMWQITVLLFALIQFEFSCGLLCCLLDIMSYNCEFSTLQMVFPLTYFIWYFSFFSSSGDFLFF